MTGVQTCALPISGRPLLLAQDRVARPCGRKESPELGFDGPVGFGDRRQVGLRLDGEAGPELRERECVGRVGKLERELEVGAHEPTLSSRERQLI